LGSKENVVPEVIRRGRTHTLSILHEYDVTPDGQRFLVGTLIGESKATPPMVILNWAADLKK
jgi:hypothetical protein